MLQLHSAWAIQGSASASASASLTTLGRHSKALFSARSRYSIDVVISYKKAMALCWGFLKNIARTAVQFNWVSLLPCATWAQENWRSGNRDFFRRKLWGLKLVPLGTWRVVPHAEVVHWWLIFSGERFPSVLQEQGCLDWKAGRLVASILNPQCLKR